MGFKETLGKPCAVGVGSCANSGKYACNADGSSSCDARPYAPTDDCSSTAVNGSFDLNCMGGETVCNQMLDPPKGSAVCIEVLTLGLIKLSRVARYTSGMAKTHPAASLSWAEGRRRRAWDLHLQGWSNKLIATARGVSPAAVSQWLARSHREGLASLAPRRRTGQGTRLTIEQQQHLLVLLKQGPEEQGFPGPFWTTRRIATLIARVFQVTYSPHHVSKLMHRVGWSYQKATVQARQRDEPDIEAWIHQRSLRRII
jgi:transposase